MASTISAGTTTTTALSYSADTSGVLQLQTNGTTTAVTIDTSQNVGVGGTPSAKLDVVANNFAGGPAISARYNTSNARIGFNIANSNGFPYIGYNTNNVSSSDTPTYDLSQAAAQLRMDNGQFRFNIAASGTAGNAITFAQAMTLDASGNLLVGATSDSTGTLATGILSKSAGGTNFIAQNTNGSATAFRFYTSTSTLAGAINTSGNTTAYTSISDYRLKENVKPLENALAKVAQLNPVSYTFKNNAQPSQGFIAHELQAIVPECVTGEKDAVDAEGNPVYQGVDTSFLVATLTSAIQELSAQVTALKG